MKSASASLFALISVLTSPSFANSYANPPSIEYPAKALADCINGEVVVEFRIVDGRATDMSVLRSTPDSLYVEAFVMWWQDYNAWLDRIGLRWGDDTPTDKPQEKVFKFEPCDT